MGFLISPREFEGLHEAFPKVPPKFDDRGPLTETQHAVIFGSIGGVLWNISRALRRKPLGLGVLKGIGACVVPFAVLELASDEVQRRECMPDIQAILKADNKALPPRKYIQFTREDTPASRTANVGLLAMATFLLYSRAPNGPKVSVLAALGAYGVGAFLGSQAAENLYKTEEAEATIKVHLARLKGSQIYSERTRKPPPRWLYGPDIGVSKGEPEDKANSPWDLLKGFGQDGVPEGAMMVEDENATTTGLPRLATPLQQGSAPHVIMNTSDGDTMFSAIRDYEWNPESVQSGLEVLQDHLEGLNAARAKKARIAEYLWATIARREADKFPPYARKDDDHSLVLERKALELLTSIHKQVYSQIADLDWCIANTKKLVLQFQSDGKWLPASSAQMTDLSEAKAKILSNVRVHKKNLEVQQTMMANDQHIEMMGAADDEKEEVRRAIRDNLSATTKLLEDLENDDGSK